MKKNQLINVLFVSFLLVNIFGCSDEKDGATSPEYIIGVGPIADAGGDQTLVAGSNIVLDGGNSDDPDAPNSELTYEWNLGLLGVKNGEVVEGNIPSNIPPGTYTVTLTVTDKEGNRATDTMTIVVESPPPPPSSPSPSPTPPTTDANVAPVAQSKTVSDICSTLPINISLDASDADGDTLTYSIVQQGNYGTVVISGSTAMYTADTCAANGTDASIAGDSFSFKVNDGLVDSNTAVVTIDYGAPL